MISQQSYKYSQCVSEHKNPWNHKYIKFQGRTHTGMCCFLCNKHSQLNFAHHVSTRVHDSQHPPLFAISDYVLMWALKSTTTLPFILQRSHFFSVKRVKFEVVSSSSTPKKKKRDIPCSCESYQANNFSPKQSIIPKLILLSTSFTTTRLWIQKYPMIQESFCEWDA